MGIVVVAFCAAATAWVVCCDDDFNLERHQLGGQLGEPFDSRMPPSPFNGDVLPLHVAKLTQSGAEGIAGTEERIRLEHSNPRNLRQLLRLGGDRRGEEAACQAADERPPVHHSIT
jgi:hypothetical protein